MVWQLLSSKVFSADERDDYLNDYIEFQPDLNGYMKMLSGIRNDRKKTTHAHLYAPTAHPAQ